MFDRLCNNPGRSKDHELLNPENFLDMLFLQIFLSLSKRGNKSLLKSWVIVFCPKDRKWRNDLLEHTKYHFVSACSIQSGKIKLSCLRVRLELLVVHTPYNFTRSGCYSIREALFYRNLCPQA
mmetsp:Transcript_18297/g.20694  ORF Transcript_18297/g.20694 Transcript_18297/m.20694 type:complete len:123 (+) Transcript_18297:324-692(+)